VSVRPDQPAGRGPDVIFAGWLLTAVLDVGGETFSGLVPGGSSTLPHAGSETSEADTHRRFLRGCMFGPGCKSRRLHHSTRRPSTQRFALVQSASLMAGQTGAFRRMLSWARPQDPSGRVEGWLRLDGRPVSSTPLARSRPRWPLHLHTPAGCASLFRTPFNPQDAVARERQIKGWTAAKKLALAEGRLTDL